MMVYVEDLGPKKNRDIQNKKRYSKVKCIKCKKEDYLSDNIREYICESCMRYIRRERALNGILK